MIKFVIFIFLFAFGVAFADNDLPINANVTQDNIGRTICSAGYTSIIRPKTIVTNKIKNQMIIDAGLNPLKAYQYELDHIIPLAVGGHPNDPRNFMLQPWDGEDGAKSKDKLEVRLQCLVCTGAIELRPAQEAIYYDWKAAYAAYMGIPCKRR